MDPILSSKSTHQLLAFAALCVLSACSSDPDTFLTYTQRQNAKGGVFDVHHDARPTDALAVNYANSVEEIFRCRATGARYTRESSDTALAGLSVFAGAAESLSISTSQLSAMGLAGAGVVELRKVFDAKGRSTAYIEAAERIHSAIDDFRRHNLNDVSDEWISPNGWSLAGVVQANIDIVDKVLNGHLPSPETLAQGTEAMTDGGAKPQPRGTTPTNGVIPRVRYPLPAHLQIAKVSQTPTAAPRSDIPLDVRKGRKELGDQVVSIRGSADAERAKTILRAHDPAIDPKDSPIDILQNAVSSIRTLADLRGWQAAFAAKPPGQPSGGNSPNTSNQTTPRGSSDGSNTPAHLKEEEVTSTPESAPKRPDNANNH